MKTIVNKIQLAQANSVTLIQDTQKNKLLEVEYVRTTVDLTGKVIHVFKNNNKEILVPESISRYRMYRDKEHFENECPIGTCGLFLDDAKTKGKYRFVHHECDRDVVDIVSISFIDGVPTEVDAPLRSFSLDLEMSSIDPVFDEDVNLDDFFSSIEEATTFHDYVVTNKEGKEEVVKGRCSFILPTEEQKPVVEELKAVLEKMNKVGLGLMLDTEYGRLNVYNYNTSEIEYDTEIGFSLTRLNLPESIKLPNLIYDYCDDSCYHIFERQTK